MLAFKFWDNFLHELDDSHVIEAFGEFVELYLVLEGEVVRVFTHLGDHNLWVMGWLGVLLGGKELLEEFLTIAKAGELYLYVLSSREGYHALGKIDNLDGFAHVEDEDLASLAHGACFKYKAASLWDEHEVADDVGMGNFDRTAILDLLAEDRNNASVAAEDVAETSGDELGGLLMVVESLTVDFTDTL